LPFTGSIHIDGHDRNTEARPVFTRLVQAVFQDPLGALNPKKTVGFTMEEPLLINGIGTAAEREQKVCQMLDTVGLDASYRKRYPSELSGGQRQRVCIGAALMLDPKLVIADEAVSALDVSVGSQILNLFREIHRDRELSLLFISHNLNIVYYMCDRIAVMYRGYIVEQGDADDVYQRPLHPYTKLLLSSVPDIGGQAERGRGDAPLETLRAPCSGACCFYHRCPLADERCLSEPQPLLCGNSHLVRCWKAPSSGILQS
ncbi:MAG TPA: ABC transporter ATP-binding protein, partial [Treponema sp.]|nr:ABC transporter ATP-binding protein [Treponema sp.]